MRELPNVTMIAIDTIKYGDTINSIQKSLAEIKPFETILFTDIEIELDYKVQQIDHLYSKEQYSKFCIKELGKYPFETSHVLITQWDGHVLDGNEWSDEFLEYDYLGARWPGETDGFSVGNGGFSLRSVKLLNILAEDPMIKGLHPEDAQICRLYRSYLEEKYDIRFPPEEIANRFAFELSIPLEPTFGFHGKFHLPYKMPIVIKRSAALGDVIATEPLMEYFHKKGHTVYLDSPYTINFNRHFFPVRDIKTLAPGIKKREINLDSAYEVFPNQLHLKSYFEIAGVKDYVLRNARLSYRVGDENRLFRRYIVIHIDRRETEHRNINNVHWIQVTEYLEKMGITVIQIGRGPREQVALHYNTVNDLMMQWVLAGAEFFLGIDSGPANMAVALGVPSIIFFGSVNPEYIYADLSRIIPLKSSCPIGKDNCWHSKVSNTGVECEVDAKLPPCTVLETKRVIQAIDKIEEMIKLDKV